MINSQKTTQHLNEVLLSSDTGDIDSYLKKYSDKLTDERSFTDFMREHFVSHGRPQRDVFIAANIPEKFGYSIISGEKHTKQRDIIIKLCLAGHFTLPEIQSALKLYGMSELYSRSGRDACIIIAANRSIYEISDVDDLLAAHGFEILYSTKDI